MSGKLGVFASPTLKSPATLDVYKKWKMAIDIPMNGTIALEKKDLEDPRIDQGYD